MKFLVPQPSDQYSSMPARAHASVRSFFYRHETRCVPGSAPYGSRAELLRTVPGMLICDGFDRIRQRRGAKPGANLSVMGALINHLLRIATTQNARCDPATAILFIACDKRLIGFHSRLRCDRNIQGWPFGLREVNWPHVRQNHATLAVVCSLGHQAIESQSHYLRGWQAGERTLHITFRIAVAIASDEICLVLWSFCNIESALKSGSR